MKRFIIISLGVIIPILLFGQAKVGTAGAQFLEIGVSARAEGMANSFLATSDDATSLYYNPAGTALLEKREVVFTHIDYPVGINYEFMGLVYPNRAGGNLGFSIGALNTGDMVETTPYHPEGTGRTFSASDFFSCLTYSRRLTQKFSLGLNLKYIGQFYADEEAHGWAFDVGTMFLTGFKSLRIGMKLSNFGPDMQFTQLTFPLPMTFHFGLAGELYNTDRHKLTLNLKGSHPPDNIEKFQTGLEYWFDSKFALRMGKYLQNDSKNYAVGAGINIPIGENHLKVDYSYTINKKMYNMQRISGGFKF